MSDWLCNNRLDFCESTSSGEQVQTQSTFPMTAKCNLETTE